MSDLLENMANRTSAETRDETAKDNIAWNYGLRLFNEGYFWECHEVLEKVWMNAAPNSREKHLVQAIIHIANAMLKLKMNRPNAANRLFELARVTLDRTAVDSDGSLMGLRKIDVKEIIRTGDRHVASPGLLPNYAK